MSNIEPREPGQMPVDLTTSGVDEALPGPHPHTSEDFADWNGIGLDERRSHIIDASPNPLSHQGHRNQALPGPHPHESADFNTWGGHDGLNHPTPRNVAWGPNGERTEIWPSSEQPAGS